jgi:methionyl-tRNA formyltransferase
VKITIITSTFEHPIFPYLERWQKDQCQEHDIQIIDDIAKIKSGDFLILVSCHQFIGAEIRRNFKYTLLLHASDLPKGRGWSPHVWDIINGSSKLTLSLLEVTDPIDTGDIWKKAIIPIQGHELYDEIDHLLFSHEINLINFAIENFRNIKPTRQSENHVTHYKRRNIQDSEIDISKSISSQWNLIRVCDINRYPPFINSDGSKFILKVRKATNFSRNNKDMKKADIDKPISNQINISSLSEQVELCYCFSYLDFSYLMRIEKI